MTIRMTGLVSNMDTDSIITQMMDAQRLKYKKTTDKQTKLTWAQEKWKDLNTKLYKLYTDEVSKMRLQGSYMTKSVSSSNEALATATGNNNAPVGQHVITIDKLASSQYVTSGKLGTGVTSSTKLLGTPGLGMTSTGSIAIKIQNGDTEKNLVVTSSTTIGDFVNACKDAGLNANYDTAQQRLFISSKNSGLDNGFSITEASITSSAKTSLTNINNLVNFTSLTSADQSKITAALNTLQGKTDADGLTDALYTKVMQGGTIDAGDNAVLADALTTLRDFAIKKIKSDAVLQVKEGIKSSIRSSYPDPDSATLDTLKTEIQTEINNGTYTLPEGKDLDTVAKERYKANQAVLAYLKTQTGSDEAAQEEYNIMTQSDRALVFNDLVEKEYKSTETVVVDGNTITKAANYQNQVNSIVTTNTPTILGTGADDNTKASLVGQIKSYVGGVSDSTGTNLAQLKLGNITNGVAHTASSTDDYSVVAASDAKITLDGSELTSTTNTIDANGITITAKGVTTGTETVRLIVSNNTQANYDMVKNFLTSYNTILKEMNTLYDAATAKGYDPLSDDEKEKMTDDQIEKWETKIKDSILRRDSNLGSLVTSMRNSMMTSVEVDGKKYSLASYGIQTSKDYSEKGLLHIYGNKEDSTYSDRDDKLKAALESDPDTVMEVLTGITQNLYKAMADNMKSIPNVRSSLTFYNDKTMSNQQTAYKKQIAINEEKLTQLEDKYYKQFSAMETAMSKLNSQTNALSNMMGNN